VLTTQRAGGVLREVEAPTNADGGIQFLLRPRLLVHCLRQYGTRRLDETGIVANLGGFFVGYHKNKCSREIGDRPHEPVLATTRSGVSALRRKDSAADLAASSGNLYPRELYPLVADLVTAARER